MYLDDPVNSPQKIVKKTSKHTKVSVKLSSLNPLHRL